MWMKIMLGNESAHKADQTSMVVDFVAAAAADLAVMMAIVCGRKRPELLQTRREQG